MFGSRVADRVRDIDRRRASIDDSFYNAAEKIDLRPCCIFRREFDAITVTLRPGYSFNRLSDDFIGSHIQFEFTMNRTRRQKYVNARGLSTLQRFPSPIDISVIASSEATDLGSFETVCDFPH